MDTWFKAAKSGSGTGNIAILSDIGAFGVTAKDFRLALEELGDVSEIALTIGSNGGDVFTGFQIYNMLARHPAHKVVTIEGLAASMASVVAMAGDEVVMPENSMLMMHDPTGGVSGSTEEIQSFGEAMAKMRANIAQAYRQRTGLSVKEVGLMMAKTTWLTATEAKAKGFADRIEKPMAMAARIDVSKFSNVPASFGRNMKDKTMSTPAEVAAAKAIVDAAASAEVVVKTPAQIRAEVVAHNSEVRSMCVLAGFPAMADKLIADDADLPAVLKALNTAKETKATADATSRAARGGKATRDNDEVSARHVVGGESEADAEAGLDPVTVYAKWNSAGR